MNGLRNQYPQENISSAKQMCIGFIHAEKKVTVHRNALEFLHTYTKKYYVGTELYESTCKILTAINVKWRKDEHIRSLVQSNLGKEVLDQAVQCLFDSAKLPVCIPIYRTDKCSDHSIDNGLH